MTDQPTMVAPRPPQEELILGRYRVLERRGTGGFGTVCACWDTRLQRRVAIKRMPVASNGLTTAGEALAEARTACMLAHPNIVTVYDFETDGTYAYLVMEHIDGLNLAELLARVEGGRLTYDEAAHVLESVASALSFAHENRVLHLDIKPTNIMIDRSGVVKLADFGMSTLASAAGYGGARGGTVGYMPPEQIEGMLVDERADVFSLACVMWQSLAGQGPFAARDAKASLDAIFRGPKPPIGDSCPELRGAGEDVLMAALAPAAASRTSSVDAFAGGLLACLGSPESGRSSLAGLLDQAGEDGGVDKTVWETRHQPLYLLVPWAWPLIERASGVLALLALLARVGPSLAGLAGQYEVVATVALCAVTAAWPPFGSLIGLGALAVAVATVAPTNASFPLAVAIAVAAGAWWLAVGRAERLASASLVVPALLPWPLAGATIAGFALDPIPAAFTGAASYLLGAMLAGCAEAGFSATASLAAISQRLLAPSFLPGLVGAGIAALVSSAVALRGSVRSGVVGQALGLACVILAVGAQATVENDGIWDAGSWGCVGLAVILFATLCFATVLRGPLSEGPDGEGLR